MTDQSLGDTVAHEHTDPQAPGPFGDPSGAAPATGIQPLTLDELLECATLVERSTTICLNGALQAEHDQLIAAIAPLVNAQGEVVSDPEASAADETDASRVRALADRLEEISVERRKFLASFRFRAIPSDAWPAWLKKHQPKNQNDPEAMQAMRYQLIIDCAVEPLMPKEKVLKLAGKANQSQINKLSDAAWDACTAGGIDVPKLPIFSLSPAQG